MKRFTALLFTCLTTLALSTITPYTAFASDDDVYSIEKYDTNNDCIINSLDLNTIKANLKEDFSNFSICDLVIATSFTKSTENADKKSSEVAEKKVSIGTAVKVGIGTAYQTYNNKISMEQFESSGATTGTPPLESEITGTPPLETESGMTGTPPLEDTEGNLANPASCSIGTAASLYKAEFISEEDLDKCISLTSSTIIIENTLVVKFYNETVEKGIIFNFENVHENVPEDAEIIFEGNTVSNTYVIWEKKGVLNITVNA